MADDDRPLKAVPDYGVGDPANTQEWIRRAFGDTPRMTDEERRDAKDAQAERKRERQILHSGKGRQRRMWMDQFYKSRLSR